MVAEMAKCQQKLGGKYLSAFPTTWWSIAWNKRRAAPYPWAPFYTIHKIMAGMFDMYQPDRQSTGSSRSGRHGRMGG